MCQNKIQETKLEMDEVLCQKAEGLSNEPSTSIKRGGEMRLYYQPRDLNKFQLYCVC